MIRSRRDKDVFRLDAATSLEDLRLPGGRLKGDRRGKYSIRINDHFRLKRAA